VWVDDADGMRAQRDAAIARADGILAQLRELQDDEETHIVDLPDRRLTTTYENDGTIVTSRVCDAGVENHDGEPTRDDVLWLAKADNLDARAEAAALLHAANAVLAEIKARSWVTEGRGPYEWDDDRYRDETRYAFDAVVAALQPALSAAAGAALVREVKLLREVQRAALAWFDSGMGTPEMDALHAAALAAVEEARARKETT